MSSFENCTKRFETKAEQAGLIASFPDLVHEQNGGKRSRVQGPRSRSEYESESKFQVHLVRTLHFIRAQKFLCQINSQYEVSFDTKKDEENSLLTYKMNRLQ